MMADIDMEGLPWVAPIGNTEANAFRGTFDGNGYRISNLKGAFGLFGEANGATIRNVRIEGLVINGTARYTGGVVGTLNGGLVENCSVVGDINWVGANNASAIVGGLIGNSTNIVRVQGCSFEGSIDAGITGSTFAGQHAGGIIGLIENQTTIKDCFISGTIQGSIISSQVNPNSMLGGVIGICAAFVSTMIVENVYSSSEVFVSSNNHTTSRMEIGGIAGSSAGTVVSVTNSAVVNPRITMPGNATGSGASMKASHIVARHLSYNPTITSTNNHAWVGIDRTTAVHGTTGVDITDPNFLHEMEWFQDQSNYEDILGWDFENTWMMKDGRPILQHMDFTPKPPMPNPNLEPIIAELYAQIQSMSQAMYLLTSERDKAIVDLSSANNTIATLENEIKDLEEQLGGGNDEELLAIIETKTQEIIGLETSILTYEERISFLEVGIELMQETIDGFVAQLDQRPNLGPNVWMIVSLVLAAVTVSTIMLSIAFSKKGTKKTKPVTNVIA